MTDIIVTAIITALATVLIMLMAIAAAATAVDDKKDKIIEEKIKKLENDHEWNNSFIIASNKSVLEMRMDYLKLEERVKKLEKKKTTKKK